MSVEEFRRFRQDLNKRILDAGNLEINRFFALDTRTYADGALDTRTKELLGLVASMVLRCDDCITYHLTRCVEEGLADDEIFETFSVGLVVGGSIVIPHLRRAVATLDELRSMS
jgi:AhpD family alkylhydroperoxidase